MPPLFYTACLCFLFLLLVGIFFFAVLESEPQSLTFPFNSTTLFIYIRNNMNALRQRSLVALLWENCNHIQNHNKPLMTASSNIWFCQTCDWSSVIQILCLGVGNFLYKWGWIYHNLLGLAKHTWWVLRPHTTSKREGILQFREVIDTKMEFRR